MKNRLLRVGGLTAALALIPLAAFAVTFPTPTTLSSGITNTQDFVNLLNAITSWMFYILMFLAVLMLIWAAYVYLTAGGDEEKIGKAKSIIIGAVIALVVAFLANGVPTLVGSFLGQ